MINTLTLKLNRISGAKEYVVKSTLKKSKRLELTQTDIKMLIKEKEKMQKAKEKLNITDEIRKKAISELTEKEKDALYEEYVLDSAIEGTIDFVEGRYYTEEQFTKEMKNIEMGIIQKEKMMQV